MGADTDRKHWAPILEEPHSTGHVSFKENVDNQYNVGYEKIIL